jgi:hypothetical protein
VLDAGQEALNAARAELEPVRRVMRDARRAQQAVLDQMIDNMRAANQVALADRGEDESRR